MYRAVFYCVYLFCINKTHTIGREQQVLMVNKRHGQYILATDSLAKGSRILMFESVISEHLLRFKLLHIIIY